MSMLRLLLAASLAALPLPALAQHAGHVMPADDMAGMDHSQMDHGQMDHGTVGKTAPAKRKPVKKPAAKSAPAKPADHSAMPGMDHGAMDHGAKPGMDHGAAHQHEAPAPVSKAPAPMAGMNHSQMNHEAMPGMDHGAMDHSAMPGMDHSAMAGMDHAAMTHGGGTSQPAGDAPAPAPPQANYADRVWGRDAMAPARAELRREHGGLAFRQVNGNLFEYQVRDGSDGLRWDGEGWYGTDLHRVFVKSEGRTENGAGVEDAELQLLYGRTVGPYTFLQAGLRQDLAPIGRTYASLGFETLIPYWVDLEGTAFLSTRGDLLARAEASYDLRFTQRLVLQPRAEVNFAAQDDRAARIGSGLSNLELGLRLRYEIRREFAPYIGVSYDRDFGNTARFARSRGEDVGATSFVVGIRSWF